MILRIFILLWLGICVSVYAENECATDFMGKVVCAPPGGTAVVTYMGEIICARGKCTTDNLGYLKCSSVKGGGVGKDLMGNVTCVGTCVEPKKNQCLTME